MGVEYDYRPVLAEQKYEAAERAKGKKHALVKDKGPAKSKGQWCVARKRRASEPGDVQLGRELARLSKKSQKFMLRGLDYDSGTADAEGVCGGLGMLSFLC